MDHDRTVTLLKLVVQLRNAAEDADRPDVVAKMDETLALITGKGGSTGAGLGKGGASALDTALTILGVGGLR